MMNGKRKFLIFILVLIAFIISVGGVSAHDFNDTCVDDAVLRDTLYASDEMELEIPDVNASILSEEDNNLKANFSSDIDEGINSVTVNFKDTSSGSPTGWLWDFGDGCNSTLQNPTHTYNAAGSYDVSLKVSVDGDSSLVLKEDFIHVYQLNSQLVNLDFESGGTLIGWDYSKASITTNFRYAKNGIRFANLQNNGYISQFINFDIIDSLSFWYKSSDKGATINVLIDEGIVSDYTIKKTENTAWEEVFVDLSNFTGYHSLKFLQTINSAYVDNIKLNYNDVVVSNFTVNSFEIINEGLLVDFNDLSIGLISDWLWDFGDGTYSVEQNPKHVFNLGNQSVKLKVYNKNASSEHVYSWIGFLPYINDTGLEYYSIQEAIDNAVDGDVIVINSCEFYDVYFENLIINKSITLKFDNATLTGKINDNPVVHVVSGAHVILDNVSFGSNVIVSSDSDSSVTIINSIISDSDVSLLNGNIILRDNLFNCSFLIIDADVEMYYCNVSESEVIVSGGKSLFVNNSFVGNDVAVYQFGGESEFIGNLLSDNRIGFNQVDGKLNAFDNIIINNGIGFNVSGGESSIHFNEIYSNNQFGLVFSCENIDYSNNWWGTNDPSYDYGLIVPDDYFDVYQVSGLDCGLMPWLIFNVTLHDLDYHYWIGGVTYYNLTIDLTHNNLGEDVSGLGSLRNATYKFLFNNESFDIQVINGFKDLLFTWGYLTGGVSEMDILFTNECFILPLEIDVVAPKITYVTPSTRFDGDIDIEIESDDSTAVIFYTLDGTNPCNSTTRLVYEKPFKVNESTTLHYTVIDKLGNRPLLKLSDIGNTGKVMENIIVDNVFVEMASLKSIIYYTIDDSSPVDKNNKNRVIYSRMFYVDKPTSFNIAPIEGYWDKGLQNDPVIGYAYFRTYTDMFSENYLKYYAINQNDAIWSQYKGDINNSGVSNYSGPLNNVSKWSSEIISSGSPVIDSNGHIYIGGEDGCLYCLNNQGLVIWKFGTTSKIICTPTIGFDGNIYFSNWMNSTVYCISPDGQLVWKYVLGDYNAGSSPVIGENGILYIVTSNNLTSNMFAFKNGTLLWNCSIPLIAGSTPIISSDGVLYLMSVNHELVAVNLDGTLKYKVNIFSFYCVSDLPVSLVRDDDLIYISLPYDFGRGGVYGNVHAYNFNSTLKWSVVNNIYGMDNIYGNPSYYKGVLYVLGGSKLHAVNASNGETLWSRSIVGSGFSASAPLISADEIIYISYANMVYAFNLSGEQLWNYTLTGKYGDPSCLSSPVLSDDGTLIVTTNQGIFAFNDVAAEFRYEYVKGSEATFRFIDCSTPGNNSYLWDFGDGVLSQEQNPIHSYNESGKYRVVLLVEHDGVYLARNTTLTVVKHDITPPSNVSAYIDNVVCVGGEFSTGLLVSLNASDDSGSFVIYYTVDGSNPVNSSTKRVYYEPFSIESNCTLSMVAIDAEDNIGNVTSISFVINDGVRVNSSLIHYIQDLLDNAEEGSKLVFDFPEIYGANFTINKPLNIVTTNNTRFIGNGVQPVFTFTDKSKGSTINGVFVENSNACGILIENASDITIKNVNVQANNFTGIYILNSNETFIQDTNVYNSTDGILVDNSEKIYLNRVDVEDSYNNGIWIYQSKSIIIANSLLENNGKDQYTSKANQVLIDDSRDISLYNNTINYGYFGIHLYHDTNGVIIDNNTIYEGVGDAILLSNSYSNVNITHNCIDGCYNGIDFMGRSVNVTIKNNLIENLHEHIGDLNEALFTPYYVFSYKPNEYVYEEVFPPDQFYNHCYNGIQVAYPASNFDEGNTVIIDNVIIKLQHRAWESRKYQGYLNTGCAGYGYNLYDGSDSYHGKTGGATSYREGRVDLVVDRVGDSSYRLRLINRLDGHYLSEIPEFDVTFIAGGFTQTVKFKDSEAVATFDTASAITTVTAIISVEVQKSVSWNIEITEGFNSSNKENDSGYEEGEAINNPDPVIPSISEYIRHHQGATGGSDVVIPDVPEVTPGTNPGNGTGNGTGSGNGSGGSGSGTGIGNGTGSGVGTGNGTSFNPGNTNGTGNSTVSGNSTEVPTNSTDVPDVSTDPINSTDVPVNSTDIPSDVPSNSSDVPVNSTDVPSNSTDVPVNSTDVSSDSSDVPVNSTDSLSDVSDDVSSEVPSDVDSTDVAVNGTEVSTNATSSDVVDVNVTNVNNTDRLENVADPEDLLNPGDLNVASQTSIESQEATKDSSSQASQESSQPKGGEVGSSGGSAGSDGSKVYEVKKVIDIENTNWQFVVAVILFALIVILGYGYRRGKDDGDEF